jgi:hypothetical protein
MPDIAADPGITVVFEDQVVAFCCPECVGEWDRATPDRKRLLLRRVMEPATEGSQP